MVNVVSMIKEKILGKKQDLPAPSIVAAMREMQRCEAAFHLSMADIADPWHVMVWAKHLDESGVSWYVIARERNHHETLKQMGIKSVFAATAGQLSLAVGQNVRAVFYANNAMKNLEMLRKFPHLTHVQMLHGDSDKPPSFRQVTRCFDEYWVSGQLGADRYALNGIHMPQDGFVHVGRPQVMGRTVGQRVEGWRDAPVVAYMPTWIGGQGDTMLSSCDRAAAIIRAIRATSAQATILFKPHPFVDKDPKWPAYRADIEAAIAETGATSVGPTEDATAIYEGADILVTDISSTMSDYLWSDRPLVVVAPHGFNANMRKSYPSIGGSYLIKSDLSNIEAQLRDAIILDSLAEERANMRKYVFGADDGRPADARFIDAVRRVSGL